MPLIPKCEYLSLNLCNFLCNLAKIFVILIWISSALSLFNKLYLFFPQRSRLHKCPISGVLFKFIIFFPRVDQFLHLIFKSWYSCFHLIDSPCGSFCSAFLSRLIPSFIFIWYFQDLYLYCILFHKWLILLSSCNC